MHAMTNVSCIRWPVGLLVLTCVCCLWSFTGAAPVQIPPGEEIGFTNEVWAVSGDTAIIHYDLILPVGKTADIRVVLRRRDDIRWRVLPTSLSGDCASGVSGGANKEIRWAFGKDCPPEMLAGDDFYFELIPQLEETRVSWWLYVAGGAAVVTAAVIGLTPGTSASPPPNTSSYRLPDPPLLRPIH